MDNNNQEKEKSKLKKSILVLLIVAIMGTLGITIANTIEKKSKIDIATGNYNVIITGNTSLSPSGLIPIDITNDTISPSDLSNYSDSIFISDFTVQGADGNPENIPIIYDIALIDSEINENLLNEYLKWELIKNDEIITYGNFSDLTNGMRYVLTDIQQDLPPYNSTADSLKLVIWINNDFPNDFDQTTLMNKSFSATIDVELYTESKIGQQHPTDSLYYNITKGSVLDNIKSTYVTSNSGINFAKISSDTNGKGVYIRKGTEDDRNPIYYYRGNVDNNNVLFANFCWKIVRTTDTGGIKMIYNGTPNDGKCTNTTGTSTQIGTSGFNTSTNSPTYVGYMYGTPYIYKTNDVNSNTDNYVYGKDVVYSNGQYTLTNTISGTYSSLYNGGLNNNHYSCFTSNNVCTNVYYIFFTKSTSLHYITLSNGKKVEDSLHDMLDFNTSDSTIKKVIENWYNSNMDNYTNDYIEDEIYCNDRSIYDYAGWNPNGGNTTTDLSFGTVGRFLTANPTVKCPRNIDKFTVSSSIGNGKLQYPVGLLTADEAVMAGAVSSSNYVGTINNTSYYLYTNTSYRLLSILHLGRNTSYLSFLNNYVNGEGVGNSFGVRPVISLKPNIKLKNGNGTSNNPYTVE